MRRQLTRLLILGVALVVLASSAWALTCIPVVAVRALTLVSFERVDGTPTTPATDAEFPPADGTLSLEYSSYPYWGVVDLGVWGSGKVWEFEVDLHE